MKVLNNISNALAAIVILPFWYIQKFIPRNKHLWVFGAWFGERYSDNSKALFEYVVKNCPNVRPVWIAKNEKLFTKMKEEGLPVVMSNTLNGVITVLRSGVAIITTDSKDIIPSCMNGIFSVWLWHGMPMKKIGKDERSFYEGKFSFPEKIKNKITDFLLPYLKNPHKDVVLSTGKFFNTCLHTSFELPYDKIWDDGLPRNDYFFSDNTEELIKETKKKYPGARLIVYMPTHRQTARKGVPFNGMSGYSFNREKFNDLLNKNNYVFFNKGHFYDKNAEKDKFCDRFINLSDSDYENLYTFLKDVDVLITDYSSIYFDFLLAKKPIILTPFDIDEYVSKERPLYFDYRELEAVKTKNWDELFSVLEDAAQLMPPSDDEVSKYHDFADGLSSERVFRHISQVLNL